MTVLSTGTSSVYTFNDCRVRSVERCDIVCAQNVKAVRKIAVRGGISEACVRRAVGRRTMRGYDDDDDDDDVDVVQLRRTTTVLRMWKP